jgi:hypothetical protein
MRTFSNTDGLINWLRQPGQFRNQSSNSVGLAADAGGVMVFATRQFHHDTMFTTVSRTSKNHATATLTPTN